VAESLIFFLSQQRGIRAVGRSSLSTLLISTTCITISKVIWVSLDQRFEWNTAGCRLKSAVIAVRVATGVCYFKFFEDFEFSSYRLCLTWDCDMRCHSECLRLRLLLYGMEGSRRYTRSRRIGSQAIDS